MEKDKERGAKDKGSESICDSEKGFAVGLRIEREEYIKWNKFQKAE